jgi:hypothetical protein
VVLLGLLAGLSTKMAEVDSQEGREVVWNHQCEQSELQVRARRKDVLGARGEIETKPDDKELARPDSPRTRAQGFAKESSSWDSLTRSVVDEQAQRPVT